MIRQIRYEVMDKDGRSEYCLQGTINTIDILTAIETGVDAAESPLNDCVRYYHKQDVATRRWYAERFAPIYLSFAAMNSMMFHISSAFLRQEKITEFIDDVLDQALDTEEGHLRAARMVVEYPATSFYDDKQTEYRLYRISEDKPGEVAFIVQYVLFVAMPENPKVSVQYSFIGDDEDMLQKLIAQKIQINAKEIIVNNVE